MRVAVGRGRGGGGGGPITVNWRIFCHLEANLLIEAYPWEGIAWNAFPLWSWTSWPEILMFGLHCVRHFISCHSIPWHQLTHSRPWHQLTPRLIVVIKGDFWQVTFNDHHFKSLQRTFSASHSWQSCSAARVCHPSTLLWSASPLFWLLCWASIFGPTVPEEENQESKDQSPFPDHFILPHSSTTAILMDMTPENAVEVCPHITDIIHKPAHHVNHDDHDQDQLESQAGSSAP